MIYLTDRKRHLTCVPYNINNLHKMAKNLNINRCFFHKNHYDIPIKRIKQIEEKCSVITSKEIVKIIKHKK